MKKLGYVILIELMVLVVFLLSSCGADGNDQGTEYAPNMYHSTPYEPLTQITDKESGAWVDSDGDEFGEYYNSNPLNQHEMTMRIPPANTVRRNDGGYLPYDLPADSLDYAAVNLKNPVDSTESVLADGKRLYNSFCSHCHGVNGDGKGKVAEVYLGIPGYKTGRYAELSEGHIFHVITHGKGRMGAHGSQMSQEERWKIAKYVKVLQKG